MRTFQHYFLLSILLSLSITITSISAMSMKPSLKRGKPCSPHQSQRETFVLDDHIPTDESDFEWMTRVHAECNYKHELLKCIGRKCNCDPKTSIWTRGQCLLKNGQGCFTSMICASGICAPYCKCADESNLEILGENGSNPTWKMFSCVCFLTGIMQILLKILGNVNMVL